MKSRRLDLMAPASQSPLLGPPHLSSGHSVAAGGLTWS
jgi:hypothetical protein